jgi:hypothetical protein
MPANILGHLNRWLRRTPPEPVRSDADASDATPPPVEPADDALRRALIVPRLVAEPWYVDRVAIDGTR